MQNIKEQVERSKVLLEELEIFESLLAQDIEIFKSNCSNLDVDYIVTKWKKIDVVKRTVEQLSDRLIYAVFVLEDYAEFEAGRCRHGAKKNYYTEFDQVDADGKCKHWRKINSDDD